jgi:hypothetical protein
VMSAASVSLLVVGAGRSAILRSRFEATIIPAHGGRCCLRRSAVRAAVPGTEAGISVGVGVPGVDSRVPEAGAEQLCLALSAFTWRERSSICCISVVLLGVEQR